MCTATADQDYPVMNVDPASGVIVAWEDLRSGANDIYAQRVGLNGAMAPGWPANGLAVCTAVQDQVGPVVATDGSGGVFIAWEDYRAGGANPNVYVQRVTASGAIASGWPANGVAICTAANRQGHPSIVTDGAGGAIVFWEDFRSGAADIYSQRINGLGLWQWAANGVAVCTAAGGQRFPVAVPDGAGGAIVAWEDTRAGASDVYAARVSGAGALPWIANGTAICTAYSDQVGVRIASDGASGALITWEDRRADNADAYAQRVGPDGLVKWTIDGLALCTEASEQYSEAICGDGSGGAFVTWVDLRDGLLGIYGQHATAGGTIASGWATDGNAICTGTADLADPEVVGDGSGGAFFAWDDARTSGATGWDVFAQRVTGTGTLPSGWSPGGSAFCSATGDQFLTALQSDTNGGALLAWFDRRSTSADIYALRISGSGGLPPVAVDDPPAPGGLRLNAAPNPIVTGTRLQFALDADAPVTMTVVDVSGRRVRTLLDGVPEPVGAHDVAWDGRSEGGAPVAAGVYFAVMRAGAGTRIVRLAVLR